MEKIYLSVVVPLYNEEDDVRELHKQIKKQEQPSVKTTNMIHVTILHYIKIKMTHIKNYMMPNVYL